MDPSPDDLTFYVETLNAAQYIEVAATALAFFEYLTTLSEEVRCIWQRSFSLGSVIFYVNRYVLLLNRLARLIQLVSWANSTESMADLTCNVVWRFSETFTLLLYIVIAGFSAIRLYAVWNSNRKLLILTLCFGMIYPITLTFYNTKLVFQALPPPYFKGCTEYSTFDSPSADLAFLLVGTGLILSFETYVVVCTWVKTLNSQRILHKANIKTPLASLIMRDGTVYFIALLILNAINLFSLRYDSLNNVAALTETIVSICLSRFMFHLREVYLATCGPFELETAGLSRIISGRNANMMVGVLGAPLDFSSGKDAKNRRVVRIQTWEDDIVEELRTPHISHDPLLDSLTFEVQPPPNRPHTTYPESTEFGVEQKDLSAVYY